MSTCPLPYELPTTEHNMDSPIHNQIDLYIYIYIIHIYTYIYTQLGDPPRHINAQSQELSVSLQISEGRIRIKPVHNIYTDDNDEISTRNLRSCSHI
jgi:hypothetical protein